MGSESKRLGEASHPTEEASAGNVQKVAGEMRKLVAQREELEESSAVPASVKSAAVAALDKGIEAQRTRENEKDASNIP